MKNNAMLHNIKESDLSDFQNNGWTVVGEYRNKNIRRFSLMKQ